MFLQLPAESAAESDIEVAARSINGSLKRPIFQKFIDYAAWLLGSLPSTDSDELCMGFAGSLLVKVFEASSEKEKVELSLIVQDAHKMTGSLFDVICLIWTKGKHTIVVIIVVGNHTIHQENLNN